MASQGIQLLKYWLAQPCNSQSSMAHYLGYKTSLTIGMWIRRGKIPENRIYQVMEIINGPIESGNKRKSEKIAPRFNLRD